MIKRVLQCLPLQHNYFFLIIGVHGITEIVAILAPLLFECSILWQQMRR
jgi:hypothetical protein